MRQTREPQDVRDLVADLAAAAARDLERVGDVLVDRAVRQQLVVLEDHAEVAPVVRDAGARDLRHVAPGDADLARGRIGLLDQQPHRRRLAGAGLSDQEDELAREDVEADPVDGDVGRAVALLDVAEGDDRAGRGQVGRRASVVGLAVPATAEMSFGCSHERPVEGTGEGSIRTQSSLQRVSSTLRCMARIESSSLPNGLPLYRVALPTRSTTVLVAFDAGARTERPDENGMAHFLEHLVFKGGQKYDDYRKVNQTAETMGAVLNAYTSHDLVAFHITCRAEVAPEAIDLLTDFVGRPKIDAEELDRERGVVIQEIARAQDTPSVVAEHLIDRAAFGEHPLGRPVLGPADHLRTFSRDGILAVPAPPVGGCARRRVPGRQPRSRARGQRDRRALRALPVDLRQRLVGAGAAVRADRRWSSTASRRSRTCACPTGRRSSRARPPSGPR